jgi:ribose/xylose/arabinose/galactoside ABC-type transport system permease subunit
MATIFLRAFGSRELLLLGACALAAAIFAIASPYFATADNLAVVLRNSVELLLVGLGITLLMAMGGIDVSVGMAMGVAAIVVGQLLARGAGPLVAGLAGPTCGAVLGLVTASVVVFGRAPAIVGTLGLLGVYRTAIFALLGGEWLSGLPSTLTEKLGIPVVALLIAAVYGLAYVILRQTPYGPHLMAIGNSEERARLSGVAVIHTRFIAYIASGLLCGLAATLYVATYRNVEMTIGGALALDAIAAAVLGGTSVLGGRASLSGTALGVLLIRILQNGLLLIGAPSLWQTVVTGSLLLIVLAAERNIGRLAGHAWSWGAR